jgi:hypothetical protein
MIFVNDREDPAEKPDLYRQVDPQRMLREVLRRRNR